MTSFAMRQSPAAPNPFVHESLKNGTLKLRSPWAVLGLSLITLGIYHLVWYHRVNKELNAYGRSLSLRHNLLEVDPGRAVLAITVGNLIIVPPFISMYRTFERIRRAEELANAPGRLSQGVAWLLVVLALPFALFFLVLPFWAVYAQSHVNALWALENRRAEEWTAVHGTRPSLGSWGFEDSATDLALSDGALRILRERYASGEIDGEQFRQIARELGKD